MQAPCSTATTEEVTIFTLRFKDTKELVGFFSSSNDGSDFCFDVSYELDRSSYTGNVWVIKDRREAEFAAKYTCEWYNALFSTPINPFVGQLEVVELVVKS